MPLPLLIAALNDRQTAAQSLVIEAKEGCRIVHFEQLLTPLPLAQRLHRPRHRSSWENSHRCLQARDTDAPNRSLLRRSGFIDRSVETGRRLVPRNVRLPLYLVAGSCVPSFPQDRSPELPYRKTKRGQTFKSEVDEQPTALLGPGSTAARPQVGATANLLRPGTPLGLRYFSPTQERLDIKPISRSVFSSARRCFHRRELTVLRIEFGRCNLVHESGHVPRWPKATFSPLMPLSNIHVPQTRHRGSPLLFKALSCHVSPKCPRCG